LGRTFPVAFKKVLAVFYLSVRPFNFFWIDGNSLLNPTENDREIPLKMTGREE